MCDVKNRNKYMIHYRMFKFYINSGMKITKIHNLYRFKQSPWLATYINKSTENRSKSNTSFEKDLYIPTCGYIPTSNCIERQSTVRLRRGKGWLDLFADAN